MLEFKQSLTMIIVKHLNLSGDGDCIPGSDIKTSSLPGSPTNVKKKRRGSSAVTQVIITFSLCMMTNQSTFHFIHLRSLSFLCSRAHRCLNSCHRHLCPFMATQSWRAIRLTTCRLRRCPHKYLETIYPLPDVLRSACQCTTNQFPCLPVRFIRLISRWCSTLKIPTLLQYIHAESATRRCTTTTRRFSAKAGAISGFIGFARA